MKPLLFCSQSPTTLNPKSAGAFTFLEMMLTMAIFSMLVAASVSSQILGLRLYSVVDAKMTVTSDARRALDTVRDEIRSGKLLYVGNGNAGCFALLPDNAPRIGNALRICPTTDTNSYVYYFLDADTCLKRMVSGNSDVSVVAHNVTNQFVFQAEDFQGNVLTNYQNNRVIDMTLQVSQTAGAGLLAQSYPLQTRIARRAIE
jgi:prepilin-type N-terminal cleavage/methylation domain-containing protein